MNLNRFLKLYCAETKIVLTEQQKEVMRHIMKGGTFVFGRQIGKTQVRDAIAHYYKMIEGREQ